MTDRQAHEERDDEASAGIDIDRHEAFLADASCLDEHGREILTRQAEAADSYDSHRALMRRRRGGDWIERGTR